jgi:uncharacterized protein (DUF608 family)
MRHTVFRGVESMRIKSSYYVSSGIPLGGIGCGTIEIRADGRFYEWHIFNNGRWALRGEDRDKEFMKPTDLYFVARVRYEGRVVVRFLQVARGYRQLEDDERAHLVMPWETRGGDPYKMPWLRSVDSIEFDGEPPFAFLKYIDEDLPVDLALEAFTPFIPGDSKNSSIPVAILVFRVRNKLDKDVEFSLLAGIKSPFSAVPAKTRVEASQYSNGMVITLTGVGISEKHSMFGGSLSLGIFGDGLETGYRLGQQYNDVHGFRRLWVEYRASGILRDAKSFDEFEGVVYSFVVGKKVLRGGEEARMIAVLAWYFPNFFDDLGNLIGHYYENFFKSSRDVAEYVIENFDYLYTYTKKFHDALYSTSIDRWLVDLIASQLTTLQKSTIYTRDGLFGVWEGYGCCGLNTTDVAFYGSIMILQLFPDLEKKWIEYHAQWQLKPDLWPYYEVFASALPENAMKLKEMIWKDPSIATDLNKFREAVRSVVKATGRDPTGRVMHFFTGSFKRPDAYDRPDMNPEYVLMVIRDAVWLGDKELLTKLWGSLKEAIEVILRTHDPLGDKLLYHYTPAGYEAILQSIVRFVPQHQELYRQFLASLGAGYTFFPISVQTFDTWSMIGVTSFTGVLWLSALKAMVEAASIVSDAEFRERLARIYEEAREKLLKYLWNGEYLDLWYDPVSGKRDRGCSSSQLDGQMFLSLELDMGYVMDREKVLSILRAIYRYNFKGEEGLINGSYPGMPRPAEAGDMLLPNETGLTYAIGSQIDTPWTGIEFEVAAHMIYEGMVKEAMDILKAVHERHVRYGQYWNHIECGDHYYRAMDSWLVLMAIENLFYNGLEARLRFAPKINKEMFRGLITVTGAWGVAEQVVQGNEQRVSIKLEKGELNVRVIEVEAFGKDVKSLEVYIDGIKVDAKYSIVDNFMRIDLGSQQKASKGIEIRIVYT